MAQAEIPQFASPGEYKLELQFTYELGYLPTRTIVVTATSPPFRVVNAPSMFNESNYRDIQQLKKELAEEKAIIKWHRRKSTYDPQK